MDYLKLMKAFSLSVFQRDALKSSALLFPLIFSTLYVYENHFREADLIAQLLLSASATVIVLLCAVFALVCGELVTGFKNGRFPIVTFSPSFLIFGFALAARKYIDGNTDLYLVLIILGHISLYTIYLVGCLVYRAVSGKKGAETRDH